MENLIKSILEQLSIVAKRNEAQPPELLKTLPNGQWELLSKGINPQKANPHGESNKVFSELFTHLKGTMAALPQVAATLPSTKTPVHLNKVSVKLPESPFLAVRHDHMEEQTGERPLLHSVEHIRGAIRQYALGLPKGQIDLGHLGKLREAQDEIYHDGISPDDYGYKKRKPISHDDMAEIINHHTGDAPSLKHIHDNNGGIDAIETLAHTHGADNLEPHSYNIRAHKNNQIWADMHDLMRPDSIDLTDWASDDERTYTPTYGKIESDPQLHREVENAHAAAHASWDWFPVNADEAERGAPISQEESKRLRKQLNTAVVKRALDRFKKYHKLP